MTIDARLNDCLAGWSGNLPQPLQTEVNAQKRHLIARLHTWVRSFAYMRDRGGDYWKNPDEFWRDKGGDCEDFAITLGTMIRRALPQVRLELVLCRYGSDRKGHAVLCVHLSEGPLYLDQRCRMPLDEGQYKEEYDEGSRLSWEEDVKVSIKENDTKKDLVKNVLG